jgi:hypothetical protein
MCVQEEGRLLTEVGESSNMVVQANESKWKGKQTEKGKKKEKGKIPIQADIKKEESKCFFCKKKGHMKKDCSKFKNWLGKRGNPISFVCYESHMVDICHNTWWIDSGSTIHISNTLQGFLNQRKPVGSEERVYSGSKTPSHVEAVGT